MGDGEKLGNGKDLTISRTEAALLQRFLEERKALGRDFAALDGSLGEKQARLRDRELAEIDRELAAERARAAKKVSGTIDDEDDDLLEEESAERPATRLGFRPHAVTLGHNLLKRLNGTRVRILGSELEDAMNALRPKKRGDCENSPRPCTWVGCQYHLYLDVNPETGSLKLNFPDLNPWELDPRYSCALDIADDGGWALERVGGVMNLTRERIRQYEVACVKKLRNALELGDLVISDEPDIGLNVEDGDDAVVVNSEKDLAKAGVAILAEGGVESEKKVVKPVISGSDDPFDLGEIDLG